MADGRGSVPPGPPIGGDPDEEIWTETGARGGSDPASGSAPAPPPRRGPARPPRAGRGRSGPDGSAAGSPGLPGAVPTPTPAAARSGRVQDHPDDGYVYEDLPGPGRLPRWLGVLLVLALFVGAIVGGAWWWYDRQLDPPGSPGELVSVEIPRGASTSGIGTILDQQGVIPSAMVFNFYASRQDAGPFLPGVYEMRLNSDVDTVLEQLAAGPSEVDASDAVVKVSIPEGLTVAEIVARTEEQNPDLTAADLDAALDEGAVTTSLRPEGQASYEGLLFPATYEVPADATATSYLDLLAGEMESRVQERGPDEALARLRERYGLDLTTYDLLKVASLVQAEAGNADEAPKIAAVIYNRLAEQSTAWTLGIDASDAYGAELEGLELSEYQRGDGAYNTRRVAGLPPTPISAPGDYALSAAFQPAEGDWMYYVLTEPRVHTFAVTEAEFLAAKDICEQKDLGCG